MTHRDRNLLRFAALSLLGAALHAQQVSYSDELFPWHRDEGFLVTRIVDALDGRPLAGVELLALREREQPLPEWLWFDRKVVSDEQGFARLPLAGIDLGWLLFLRDGHAPRSEHRWCDAVVALMPGIDVPVEIQDERGLPVAGARLGFAVGCGHTPDVRNAVTDARGCTTIGGIDPTEGIRDLYAVHPWIDGNYEDVSWQAGDAPQRFRWRPSIPVRGRLLDENGEPLRGAFVGTSVVHRGPWTRTDAAGRFELIGCELSGPLDTAFLRAVSGGIERSYQAPMGLPQVELRFIEEPERPARDATLRLQVLRGDAQPALVRAEVEAWVVRDGHWFQVFDETIPAEPSELPLPSGEVLLRVRAADAPWPIVDTHAVVDARRVNAHAVVLPEPRRIRVAMRGGARGWQIRLQTASGAWDIEDGTCVLPADGVVAFKVSRDGAEAIPEVIALRTDVAKLPDQVELAVPEPTRIRGRITDAAGAPVRATLELASGLLGKAGPTTTSDDGSFELQAWAGWKDTLCCTPEDTSLLRMRMLRLALPEPGMGQVVTIGEIRLPPRDAPRLRILGYDGTPLTNMTLEVTAPGRRLAADLDEDGGYDGPDLREHDCVGLRTEYGEHRDWGGFLVQQRWQLTGDGPWTLRIPPGCVHLRAVDPQGMPIEADACLGENEFSIPPDGATLVGLSLTPQRLFLGAADRRTAIVDFTPAAGDAAPTLRIVLPPRR